METISDCILLKIFNHLEIRDLIKCCFICKTWKRIAYDSSLWLHTDLRPFRWRLDEHAIIRLIQLRFKPFLKSINLSGFSLTPKVFTELHKQCPTLTSLILENVTFIGFNGADQFGVTKFPTNLELLDLRYSTGDEEAFTLISNNLLNVKYIGINNSTILNANEVCLFRSLNKVEVLDFSYCNALFDAALILIGTFCTQLVSLSFFHCNNITGNGLDLILRNCRFIKSLTLSGTSLTDANLMNCIWKNVGIEELDISWCRNITERGMKAILPHLNKLKYLRLCSCGFGHALTDDVLDVLSNDWYSDLQIIDLSYSREITDQAVSKLIQTLPALKQIKLSCCRKLTSELKDKSSSTKNLLILASFCDDKLRFSSQGMLGTYYDTDDVSNDDHRRYSFKKQMLRYWG